LRLRLTFGLRNFGRLPDEIYGRDGSSTGMLRARISRPLQSGRCRTLPRPPRRAAD
jgi:hypothetical protein